MAGECYWKSIADRSLSGIPVVVMIDSPGEEIWLRSRFTDVDGFVTKPLYGDKFRRLILALPDSGIRISCCRASL